MHMFDRLVKSFPMHACRDMTNISLLGGRNGITTGRLKEGTISKGGDGLIIYQEGFSGGGFILPAATTLGEYDAMV